MRRFSWLNIVLIGLVVLLGALLVDGNRADRFARAQEERPLVGVAGGVIAVPGRYQQDVDILYIVDTNQQTILVYSYHRTISGGGRLFDRGEFELLAGRTYKWDTMAASRVTIGKQAGPAPEDTRNQFLKNKDK